jgi:hypothetical protein
MSRLRVFWPPRLAPYLLFKGNKFYMSTEPLHCFLFFVKCSTPPSNEDEMHDATACTRSLISGMREEAAKRATKLKLELSDLKTSLGLLHLEAATTSGARNRVRRSVEDGTRKAKLASTREIEGARSGLVKEKRIESHIERALADAVPAVKRVGEMTATKQHTAPEGEEHKKYTSLKKKPPLLPRYILWTYQEI